MMSMSATGGSEFPRAVTFANDSFYTQTPPDCDRLSVGALAQALFSTFEGPNVIDRMGCINRSRIGGYSNLGFGSYIADSIVGRYCNFGARVSIGGYEHPQNWLGITAYQWGKSTESLVSAATQVLLETHPPPCQMTTVIGSDVWIGDNTVVKRGVTIGSGAIIGAGSVVTKDVPPFAVVIGVPARVLRFRFEPILRQQLLAERWWEMELEELADLPFHSVVECLKILSMRSMQGKSP